MNRYYSSQWGRFLSPDPYGGSAKLGSPQTWNRYVYVAGDPMNRHDPSGLDDVDEGDLAVGEGFVSGNDPNPGEGSGDSTGATFTNRDFTGMQTSGYGTTDPNGTTTPIPIVGSWDPNVANATVTVNGDSSESPTDTSVLAGTVQLYAPYQAYPTPQQVISQMVSTVPYAVCKSSPAQRCLCRCETVR